MTLWDAQHLTAPLFGLVISDKSQQVRGQRLGQHLTPYSFLTLAFSHFHHIREFYKCAREPEAQCKMFSTRALASSRDHSTWPKDPSIELISLLPPPAAWADEIRGRTANDTWHKLGTSNSAPSAELLALSQTQPESSQRQVAVNESQTQVEFPGIPSTPARNRRREMAGLPTPSRTNDGRQLVASSSGRAAESVGTFASGAPPAARLPQGLPSPPRSSAALKLRVREPSPDWPSDDDVDWDSIDLEAYDGVAVSSPSAAPRRAPTVKARTTTAVKRELVSDEDEIGEFASSMVDSKGQKPFSFGRRIHAVKRELEDEDDQGAVARRGTSGNQARSKKVKVDDAVRSRLSPTFRWT